MLEHGGMVDCKLCKTPMEERLKLSKNNTTAKVDTMCYKSIVDELRYLTHTWLDITFAIGYASRFMEDPREQGRNPVEAKLGSRPPLLV